jgi:hypothetical protein
MIRSLFSLLLLLLSQPIFCQLDTIDISLSDGKYNATFIKITTIKGFDFGKIGNYQNANSLSIKSAKGIDLNLLFINCKTLKNLRNLEILNSGVTTIPNSISCLISLESMRCVDANIKLGQLWQ